jgi:hypothetical protein
MESFFSIMKAREQPKEAKKEKSCPNKCFLKKNIRPPFSLRPHILLLLFVLSDLKSYLCVN